MHDSAQAALREILSEGEALPFSAVVLRLRRRGTAVTEEVLERRLRAPGSGARVLNPWRGPHASLCGLLSQESELGEAGLWVVPEAEVVTGERSVGNEELSRALGLLARRLDERSPRDVSRWIALVQEARALRGRAA
jgi:hypothetical protein